MHTAIEIFHLSGKFEVAGSFPNEWSQKVYLNYLFAQDNHLNGEPRPRKTSDLTALCLLGLVHTEEPGNSLTSIS